MNRRQIVSEIKKCTYKIALNKKICGTAFKLHASKIFVSCEHVLMNNAKYNGAILIDENGHEHAPKIIMSDTSSDICIFEIPTIQANESGAVLGNYADIEEGDDVFVCGFPFGFDKHVTHAGMISRKGIINGRSSIQIDGSINKGNSGGGCFYLDKSKNIKVCGVIATRIVGVNFSLFDKLKREMKASTSYTGETQISTGVIRGLVGILNIIINHIFDIFVQLDRFVNVGFGEAVSVEYVKDSLEKSDKSQN